MPDPFFSICIPCFNSRRFLAATLESVSSQRYPHWELIVVEDGSREPVADLVDAFRAAVTQSVRYLAHPANRGLPAARDTAIAAAQGSHVALLDSDDLWRPDHLEQLAAAIGTTNADITFSAFEMFESTTGETIGTFRPTAEDLARFADHLFCQRFWVIPSAIAVRRSLFSRLGPWSADMDRPSRRLSPPPSRGEDTNFWLRALHAGVTWSFSQACTLRYRRHGESVSKKFNDAVIYQSLVYNVHGPLPGPDRREQVAFISRLNTNGGKLLCRFGDRRAVFLFWWAWTWRPTRLVNLVLIPSAAAAPAFAARVLHRLKLL